MELAPANKWAGRNGHMEANHMPLVTIITAMLASIAAAVVVLAACQAAGKGQKNG